MNKIILELVSCDLCGFSKYKTRYSKPDTWLNTHQYEFQVVQCINCGLVFLNPRPTIESINVFYPLGYHDGRNTEEFLFRYKVQAEYMPTLKKEKVLDIGCARGDFLNFLKNRYPGISVHGVDLFSEKIDFDFIDFKNKSLTDADFPSDTFDYITAWAVFEHLHNPGDYFKEVNRILKKGGRFYFLVTNSESIYGKYAYKEDIPRHTYHFSQKTLDAYALKFKFHSTKYYYETRLWDSTGRGFFKFKFMEFAGSSWESRSLGSLNKFQYYMGKIGEKIDDYVFSSNWEASLRRSGIIVAEFCK